MNKLIPALFSVLAFMAALAGPATALDDEPGGPSGGGGCVACEYRYERVGLSVMVKARCASSGGMMGFGHKGCTVYLDPIEGNEWCQLDKFGPCASDTGGGGGGVIG